MAYCRSRYRLHPYEPFLFLLPTRKRLLYLIEFFILLRIRMCRWMLILLHMWLSRYSLLVYADLLCKFLPHLLRVLRLHLQWDKLRLQEACQHLRFGACYYRQSGSSVSAVLLGIKQ